MNEETVMNRRQISQLRERMWKRTLALAEKTMLGMKGEDAQPFTGSICHKMVDPETGSSAYLLGTFLRDSCVSAYLLPAEEYEHMVVRSARQMVAELGEQHVVKPVLWKPGDA